MHPALRRHVAPPERHFMHFFALGVLLGTLGLGILIDRLEVAEQAENVALHHRQEARRAAWARHEASQHAADSQRAQHEGAR